MSALLGMLPSLFRFSRDPMTSGPVLPPGWDGDAWVRPCALRGESYLLRAWHIATGQLFIGRGLLYVDARRHLLDQVYAH
jgi:hypothetical protein